MKETPKANILLVDDQPENLLALEACLAPLGHRLFTATSGLEALKCLLTHEFALVLLDVQMPDLDGFETAAYIKRREKTKNLPIIFITAINKEQHHVFRGYTSGGVDYVFKPVEGELLRSKVQVFVDLHTKERALHESEERFRRAFEDAPIGIGLVSAESGWLRVNRVLCDLTGYSEEELLATTLDELLHPDDRAGNAHHFRDLLAGEVSSYKLEGRCLRGDGQFVWIVVSASRVSDVGGQPLYVIAQIEDIGERKRAERELVHQALHDSLTGLPNRALFADRLELAIRRLERRASQVAVLFLDVDRFKVVNDSLGHDCGDELLVAIAQRLRGVLRPSDTVARLGGDEFTILCEETNEREVVAVAQRVLHAIAQPFELGGTEAFVTGSLGIVLARDASARPGALIRDADAAMYRAKENGKARFELFDDEMRAHAVARLTTENALHRALERGELSLYYQPEVDLRTRRLRGVEALLRWNHPERGIVGPCEFIALAEETGLIVPVGKWVLEEACRQAQTWQRELPGAPPLCMAVNLSARQFAQPDLVDVVGAALGEAALDPALLCLEVTESVLMDDTDQTLAVLAALKGLGVRLSIDDFGTGYSSLSYLKRFEADNLKVDRSFVEGLDGHPHNAAILAAVVRLAEALDLTPIAEGVETAAQLSELRTMGFVSAQGFHFAPPQPEEGIRALLASPAGRVPRRAGSRRAPAPGVRTTRNGRAGVGGGGR